MCTIYKANVISSWEARAEVWQRWTSVFRLHISWLLFDLFDAYIAWLQRVVDQLPMAGNPEFAKMNLINKLKD